MTTLTLRDAFGEPFKVEAEIGESKIHGYLNEDGTWALHRSDRFYIPAEYVALRFKGKRKSRWVLKQNIIGGFPT